MPSSDPSFVPIENFKPATEPTGAFVPTVVCPDGRKLDRLGEYRLLREVGRGGMGIVYEAEQVSLGRHVALKVLPASALLNPTYLERFRREAKAAARLHHTNIVPVFGVGEHDGVPFYAMQFIHGEGLDRVLAEIRRLRQEPGDGKAEGSVARGLLTGQFNPSALTDPLPEEPARSLPAPLRPTSGLSGGTEGEYYRGVARVGVQVAEALAYAHRQGVLHRDIKPSNLLLDRQGTVWVTDFGLAKAEGTDELTQAGDIVGTLRFMAPERFGGRSLPQSDVYALGLTLYEMLTLRPAFTDADRARLIDKVLHQAPVAPRTLDGRIPRDLETIVLKCLAKDPAERYPSAEALAEDLSRFLADRPIRARRSTLAEEVWRWCRRNPVVATLSAVVLLLLTVTAIGGVTLAASRGRALREARAAEREGKRKLLASYVSEADATRVSRRPGQRFNTLRKVREALEVAREVGLSDEDRMRLRNIAIAALCLPDIELGREGTLGQDGVGPDWLDPEMRCRARARAALSRLPAPAFQQRGESWVSPDGHFIAAGTRGYEATRSLPVRVWRVDGAEPVPVLDAPQEVYEDATAFRPDSREVAFGHPDGSVSLHDLETGQRAGTLERGPGPVFCLAYHPHLPRLAVANGNTVSIWDLKERRRLLQIAHPSVVSGVAWHPHGHRLAGACFDRLIYLWDADTGQPVTVPWKGHRTESIRLAFSHAGDRVVSNDWGDVLRLWDCATGQQLLSLPGPGLPAFSMDDRSLLHCSGSGALRELRVAGGQEMRMLHRPTPRGPEWFSSASLHPDGRLLAVTTERGLGLFDVRTGEEKGFLAGSFFPWLSFDRTGALWTAGGAGVVRWPVRQAGSAGPLRLGPPQRVADPPLSHQFQLGTSADGRVLAVPLSSEGALVVHRTPSHVRTVRVGPQYDVRSVLVSPDGHWVVTSSHWVPDTEVRSKVWEADTGRLVASLPYPDVSSVNGFTPDSRWLYISGKQEARLEVASLASSRIERPEVEPSSRPPWQEAWQTLPIHLGSGLSPDGLLAAAGLLDGGLQLTRGETNEKIAVLPSPEPGRVGHRGFSADGALLLAHGDETQAVYVFDLRRIRDGLAELGLDWDLPPYPPPQEEGAASTPFRVELQDAEWGTSRQKMAEYERKRALERLYLDPGDAEANWRLGARLLEAGKLATAYGHLSAALALAPDRDEPLRAHGQAALKLGRWAEAVADASRSLAKYPFDTKARMLRAEANLAGRRYQEAADDLSAVLRAYPKDVRAAGLRARCYELRARCYAALGKGDLAQADREQALKAGADNPKALNNMAWRLATDPAGQRDVERALELIQKAVKLEPGNATFLNTLGVVQYRNGLYREAAETLQKSLAAGGGGSDAFDLFFLAMCHARLGRRDRAKECFDQAVRWVAAQKGLPPAHAEELAEFRAEAEEVLGSE